MGAGPLAAERRGSGAGRGAGRVSPLAAVSSPVKWERRGLPSAWGWGGGRGVVRGEAAVQDACVDRMWGPRGPGVRLGTPFLWARGALSQVPRPLLVSGPGEGPEV